MSRISSSSAGGSVKIQDSSGNSLNSTSGALDVNVVSAPSSSSALIQSYNEVTNVTSGVETVVVTYTNNNTNTCYLQRILAAGTNVSEYRVYRNSNIVDKQYLCLSQYNTVFEYQGSSYPGIKLDANDVISIKVIHSRPYVGNFNASIQVLEVS